ncbi:single-stranded DNA-binding protein [Fodinicola acaciae]|uniref:single-stranded DNA-binding protein n=1 Tax=Fodinicola acaciae TaxID=2681555 RepID=UPI0013D5A32F|nr:single-stranded DNA-binding protein [Fodinicola acaciae]
MSGEPLVTMVGNVAGGPHLKKVRNGWSVCNFTIAANPRRFDATSKEWKDDDPLFLRVNCWHQMAKNVAASLVKGDPVVVYGRFLVRQYEVEGQRRTSNEIEAISVGPNLQFGQCRFSKEPAGPPEQEVVRAA